MTSVLSKKGRIVLPSEVRRQPGDDFEVVVEDDETILLRRINRPPNHRLVELLEACPHPFDVPERHQDDTSAVAP
jgi:AbrB family looped-hinge helix DNA binding protein